MKGWVTYEVQPDAALSAANLGTPTPTALLSADLALALFGGPSHASIVPGSPSPYS